jgi:hypothetical protein
VPNGVVVVLCDITNSAPSTIVIPPVPSEVQSILKDFEALFVVRTYLPIPRACDHATPLVLGASLVVVWTYSYAPTLKDEIEKHH